MHVVHELRVIVVLDGEISGLRRAVLHRFVREVQERRAEVEDLSERPADPQHRVVQLHHLQDKPRLEALADRRRTEEVPAARGLPTAAGDVRPGLLEARGDDPDGDGRSVERRDEDPASAVAAVACAVCGGVGVGRDVAGRDRPCAGDRRRILVHDPAFRRLHPDSVLAEIDLARDDEDFHAESQDLARRQLVRQLTYDRAIATHHLETNTEIDIHNTSQVKLMLKLETICGRSIFKLQLKLSMLYLEGNDEFSCNISSFIRGMQ